MAAAGEKIVFGSYRINAEQLGPKFREGSFGGIRRRDERIRKVGTRMPSQGSGWSCAERDLLPRLSASDASLQVRGGNYNPRRIRAQSELQSQAGLRRCNAISQADFSV